MYPNLLDSAVHRATTTIGDLQKYPTVEMATAATFHSLVLNHPFENGNKRTALVALLVMLDENNFQVTCSQDALFQLVVRVAQHSITKRGIVVTADSEVQAITAWLRANTRHLETGERVIKWIRLKRILRAHGCSYDIPKRAGNRLDIYRDVFVPKRFRFGRPSTVPLYCQVYCAGDGTDADRETVAYVRKRLWLDDDRGVDSRAFYEMESRPAEDFIAIYRKTLKRLSRL